MFYVKTSGNIKIAVDDINPHCSKAVLFVHGWPLSQEIFEYQKFLLPQYGYRVVTMDLRGFGNSDAPCNGYGYSQMAGDVLEVVKYLRLKNFVLAGFSMGGAIVLRYMSLFKGYEVCKLALLAAAAPKFTRCEGYPYGMTVEEVERLLCLAKTDRPEMVTQFGKLLLEGCHSDSVKVWFNLISLSASGTGTIKTLESLRDEDLRSELSCVKVKTGIFHGVKDQVCPYEFAKLLNQGIPNSWIYTFEQSGHGVFYDELQQFNKAFLSFLEC